MLKTINYNLNKPESNDTVDITKINENMVIVDKELKSIADKIDSELFPIIDPVTVPTGNQGFVKALLGGLANRIKAITGKTNWWDTPTKSLEQLSTDKVDKITGKGLSTNDFDASYKTKVDGIAINANNYTHPANHAPSIITQDASNRFVSDTEKNAWNAKETPTGAQAKVDALSNSVATSLAEMLTKAGNETITGNKQIITSRPGFPLDSSGGAFEIQGTSPTILLHRPGAHATYLGLDTDNILKIGGYSLGANKYKILDQRDYDTLFQYANNGKTVIANVVGGVNVNNTHAEITNRITAINDTLNNILQSTDRSTLTRTIDWLYQRTTDLAWQLNAKGVAGVGTDGLSILIQRIANINIGKKLASGTAFCIAGSKLKVTGLTFKPTYVLTFSSTYGWGMNVVGREYNTAYHYNGGVFDDNGFHNGGVVGNTVSGGFYITNTEFVVPMAPNSQGIAFDWIAIE